MNVTLNDKTTNNIEESSFFLFVCYLFLVLYEIDITCVTVNEELNQLQ